LLIEVLKWRGFRFDKMVSL